ncbi:hypothetical protein CUN67_09810 [Pantoea cypripedii]|uniref:Uncharacterized protein n=1 Tax=Pantoea cypripedii TaxID=55209 RepID=A0A6B9G4J8_PANCY|nr:hypothetical protein CUN67_09810 [Pantoea cypripedii]
MVAFYIIAFQRKAGGFIFHAIQRGDQMMTMLNAMTMLSDTHTIRIEYLSNSMLLESYRHSHFLITLFVAPFCQS